jgi:outer membrane protein
MKKILTVLAVVVFACSGNVFAQKTGHVNLNDILMLMPERKKAEEDIQTYAKELDTKLKSMSQEYESKIQEYQAKESLMTDPIKQDKQKEIAGLEERIKDFQTTAQESLQKKQNELLEPMVAKAKKAIEDVAKENGYRNVIDSSLGVLLYMNPDDDLMPLVKKKMGLVSPPAGGTTPTAPSGTKTGGK